jgi:radical SAM protein with 4Fe4S-binding SPASM domain
MNRFFLRREPFGGVLYYAEQGRLKFLNSTGYEICSGLARAWNDEKILSHIASRFDVDDPDLALSDIRNLRNQLSHAESWPKSHGISVGAVAAPIPALSAPLEIHWEITGKCNLKCLHCYNDSTASRHQPSLEQIRSVVDELADANIKVRGIIISGGEPLMHPHAREILELVRPHAAELVLATNGTLVNESNIKWIARLVDAVNVSVDAGDADSFANFRRHVGVLDKVVNALRLFRRHNVPLVAQTTLSRHNIDGLDKLAALLKSEDVRSWIVRTPIPIGRAETNDRDFLTLDETIAKEDLFRRIRETYASDFDAIHIGNRFMWSFETPFVQSEPKMGLASCAAGTMLTTIRADGTMIPCAIFGDTDNPGMHSEPVWHGNFLAQWHDAACFKTMRHIRLECLAPCSRCGKLADTCDTGCRAIAFHAFGKAEAPDPNCNYVRRDLAGPDRRAQISVQ